MANDFSTIDPFTQVYNALMALFAGDIDLTALVRPGNRISFTADDNPVPIKDAINTADLPEISLVPTGTGSSRFTTTGVVTQQAFRLEVTTGDMRADELLFPLKWILTKRLTRARNPLGLDFVKAIEVVDMPSTLDDEDQERGHDGWTFDIAIIAHLAFTSTELSA